MTTADCNLLNIIFIPGLNNYMINFLCVKSKINLMSISKEFKNNKELLNSCYTPLR
jgi:hypothetical protein